MNGKNKRVAQDSGRDDRIDEAGVVAFYAPPIMLPQYQNRNEPKPNFIDIVAKLKAPIHQGHYGTADAAIPTENVLRFEQARQ